MGEVGEDANDLEEAFLPKGSAKPVLRKEAQDPWGMNAFTQELLGLRLHNLSPVTVPAAHSHPPVYPGSGASSGSYTLLPWSSSPHASGMSSFQGLRTPVL